MTLVISRLHQFSLRLSYLSINKTLWHPKNWKYEIMCINILNINILYIQIILHCESREETQPTQNQKVKILL